MLTTLQKARILVKAGIRVPTFPEPHPAVDSPRGSKERVLPPRQRAAAGCTTDAPVGCVDAGGGGVACRVRRPLERLKVCASRTKQT